MESEVTQRSKKKAESVGGGSLEKYRQKQNVNMEIFFMGVIVSLFHVSTFQIILTGEFGIPIKCD